MEKIDDSGTRNSSGIEQRMPFTGARKDFEVYVHVPFCLRRCGYCDFNTYTARDLGEGASRANYAKLAVREMQVVKDWQVKHGIHEPPASTVFFGGGTPTILPARDLAYLLKGIRETWGIEPDAEITTEANPDTVNEEYIRTLAEAGFTRISFGMQSAVPHVLRTLDRTHTPANVVAGVRAAERYGLRSSVDLIYGAPGESLDDWRTSVRAAIDLGVNHVSAYALTVEPETKMGRQIAAGTLPKPADDDEAAKYEITEELLSAAGFSWYEISNWARPGNESRHNLGYWRNVDWAGIGPGAHSHYAGLRAWDIAHPRAWARALNAGQVPWQGSESVTVEETLEETIMLGLRLREGLDLGKLPTPADAEGARKLLEQLEKDDLVVLEGERVVPTLRGRLLNDTVIQEFFEVWL